MSRARSRLSDLGHGPGPLQVPATSGRRLRNAGIPPRDRRSEDEDPTHALITGVITHPFSDPRHVISAALRRRISLPFAVRASATREFRGVAPRTPPRSRYGKPLGGPALALSPTKRILEQEYEWSRSRRPAGASLSAPRFPGMSSGPNGPPERFVMVCTARSDARAHGDHSGGSSSGDHTGQPVGDIHPTPLSSVEASLVGQDAHVTASVVRRSNIYDLVRPPMP
jgi:hypothetical protein